MVHRGMCSINRAYMYMVGDSGTLSGINDHTVHCKSRRRHRRISIPNAIEVTSIAFRLERKEKDQYVFSVRHWS